MPPITLITTSPFPGQEQLREVTFPSLMAQTCKDFVWMYLDGCFSANRQLISEFADYADFEVVHVPLMHDRRTAHRFHWEPYNSALLLCDTKYFLRWGRFRDYHPRAVEHSVDFMAKGFAVDFMQKQASQAEVGTVTPWTEMRWENVPHPVSSCGMFGMRTRDAINVMNGNDEVGLQQNHFEDVEMNGRMKNITGIPCKRTEDGLVRFKHDKSIDLIRGMDNPSNVGCGSPGCPHTAPGFAGRREAIETAGHSQKYVIDGMDFWTCNNCGSLAPGDADEYRDWVHARGKTKALTNIAGHGRDLPAIKARLSGMRSLQSRVETIEGSYA